MSSEIAREEILSSNRLRLDSPMVDVKVRLGAGGRLSGDELVVEDLEAGAAESGDGAAAENEGGLNVPAGVLEKQLEQAREEGRREGVELGRTESERDFKDILKLFREAKEQIDARAAETVRAAEQDAVEVALAAARKIIRAEIGANPDVIVSVMKDALARVADRERVVVRAHPEDVARLYEWMESSADRRDGIEGLRFVEDPTVERGGCVLETQAGQVDAQISSQLQEIERIVREERPAS